MILRMSALAIAALSLTAPAAAERPSGDEKLAKVLDGRVAGEPTTCIPTMPNGRLYIIDDTAVVYDAGRTIYVNYTQYPETLDDDDVIVSINNGSQLCRTSRLQVRSPYAGSIGQALFLTEFIPYRRTSEEG